jgi:hypothetical protein
MLERLRQDYVKAVDEHSTELVLFAIQQGWPLHAMRWTRREVPWIGPEVDTIELWCGETLLGLVRASVKDFETKATSEWVAPPVEPAERVYA